MGYVVRQLTETDHQLCDFCGDPHPRMIYAAKRKVTGETEFNWRWAACAECHALLSSNDLEKIGARMTGWLMKLGKMRFDAGIPLSFAEKAMRHSMEEFTQYVEVRA